MAHCAIQLKGNPVKIRSYPRSCKVFFTVLEFLGHCTVSSGWEGF